MRQDSFSFSCVFEFSADSRSDRELGGPRSGCKECTEPVQLMSELSSRDWKKLGASDTELIATASEKRLQTGDLDG